MHGAGEKQAESCSDKNIFFQKKTTIAKNLHSLKLRDISIYIIIIFLSYFYLK